MNTIETIHRHKEFFRLQESYKATLWDICTEFDITDNYDKICELLISAMQQTWRMK